MIRIENAEVRGWEAAIRGMRNPMNSWEKSDSGICKADYDDCHICAHGGCQREKYGFTDQDVFCVGVDDFYLMQQLAKAGTDHGKFMRFVTVTLDIIAPLYWWKEFDTYKVGTVSDSCSTMHKLHSRDLRLSDFSHEAIDSDAWAEEVFRNIITVINQARQYYVENGSALDWKVMIQLLPESYNQRRTILLNYQVLQAMYKARRNHKLSEWREFCSWVETLPYSELITGEGKNKDENRPS